MKLRGLLVALGVFCALLRMSATGEEIYIVESNPNALYQEGGFPAAARAPVKSRDTGLQYTLYKELMAESSSIDVSAYRVKPADFESIYYEVINAHGDLFFVESRYRYSYNTIGGVRYVLNVMPAYRYTGGERARKLAEFNAEIDNILAYASNAVTALGKVMLVNDYFCLNYKYDYSYSIYDAHSLFTLKTGVCQAYMLGFRAVMEQLGINCLTATSESMNHTWNMVNVNGEWYHIDVTWNDPEAQGRAGHGYFLTSDAGLDGHYGWVSAVSADSAFYEDFFWTGIQTAIPVSGDVFYYVDANSPNGVTRTLRAWDESQNAARALVTFDARWVLPGGGYYDAYQGFCGIYRNSLYYSTYDSIYQIGLNGGAPNLVYTADSSGGWIYGGYVMGGTAYYWTGESPTSQLTPRTWDINLSVPSSLTLTGDKYVLYTGESFTLTPVITPDNMSAAIVWGSENHAIATVDQSGTVTALLPGDTAITATLIDYSIGAAYALRVEMPDALILPEDTRLLRDEAFQGAAFKYVVANAALERFGSRSFAYCPSLRCVIIPGEHTAIGLDTFEGCGDILIICVEDSPVWQSAEALGFRVRALPEDYAYLR